MGPLAGLKVVEMASIGPTPYCGMLLADMGAEVLSVRRPGSADLGLEIPLQYDLLNRGKHPVAVDLKSPEGVALVADLIAGADVLIEGFRPGVMERLGLGPEVFRDRNPRLIYGRMTGWGQDGPLSARAGHDINYIAMSGAMAAMGPAGGAPAVPLNLVGDFGGGSLFLAMGILAAIYAARASGQGQVVDAAMIDGVGSMMTMHYGYWQAGIWSLERGTNPVDGGAPWYTTYATADGGHMAVGAVERRFYAELLGGLGINPAGLPDQHDKAGWPQLRALFAERFASRSRDDWETVFAPLDACVSPILNMQEAIAHPLAQARAMFRHSGDVAEPIAAPRFSGTPTRPTTPPRDAADTSTEVLRARGIDPARIAALVAARVIPG